MMSFSDNDLKRLKDDLNREHFDFTEALLPSHMKAIIARLEAAEKTCEAPICELCFGTGQEWNELPETGKWNPYPCECSDDPKSFASLGLNWRRAAGKL